MKIIILILILIFSVNILSAETINGRVLGKSIDGENTPLSSAKLFWLESGEGTVTDREGYFSINKSSTDNNLVASYVTYQKDTIEVKNQNDLVITLKSDYTSEVVEITGRQQGLLIDNSTIVKTDIITGQGLKKAACCNLSESFQTNASVDVEYSDAVSGAKQIMLLGLDGIYTQFMFEKIPTLRGIASTYGLNYVPGAWMEAISISKGAASVSTGYESITGQITVDYKKPWNSKPLYVNLFANQYGRLEADITTAYEINDEWSTMLLVHGNTMKNKVDENDDSFIDIPMTDQINIMNRWEYQDDILCSQFGIQGLYEDRLGGQKDYFDVKDNSNLYGLDIRTERFDAFAKNGLNLDGDNNTSLAIILSASKHRQDAKMGNRNYLGDQKSLYANVIFDHILDAGSSHESTTNHKISIGSSFQYDEYDEVFDGLNFNRIESVPGVFGEYTLSTSFDLTLVGGLRADFHNIHGTFILPRAFAKYSPGEETSFRISAGKGIRTSNIFAENIAYMISSREFMIEEVLEPEEAWNYGINMNTVFELFDTDFILNVDYFRTDFQNQIITDIDRNPEMVYFHNLDGVSYSNSFQIDLIFKPIRNLELTAAYRLNDVKMTINDELLEKPLVNKNKAFFNALYTTKNNDWSFDYTIEYRGGGRLPNTSQNPVEFQLDSEFEGYFMMHTQVTYKYDNYDIYIGVENLTSHVQENPILGASDPFGDYFDSSIIWAPIHGRTIYLGIRMSFE